MTVQQSQYAALVDGLLAMFDEGLPCGAEHCAKILAKLQTAKANIDWIEPDMNPDRLKTAVSVTAALAASGPVASFQAQAVRDVLGMLELQTTAFYQLQTQLARRSAETEAFKRAIANLVGCEPSQVSDPYLTLAAYHVRQEQAIRQLTDRIARAEREKDAMTELAMRAAPAPRSEP